VSRSCSVDQNDALLRRRRHAVRLAAKTKLPVGRFNKVEFSDARSCVITQTGRRRWRAGKTTDVRQ